MDHGRYVFSFLACLGNMICLLGRDTMRLAVLPMQEELHISQDQVSHILGKGSFKKKIKNIWKIPHLGGGGQQGVIFHMLS